MIGGLLIGAGGGVFSYLNYQKVDEVEADLCSHGVEVKGRCSEGAMRTYTRPEVEAKNGDGQDYSKKANIGWGIVAVGGLVAAIGVYKVFIASKKPSSEHANRGRRD